MRVLFVEDSATLRTAVRRALRHAGYAVDAAADGEEGLAAAEATDYDALILDVMLPKLDGLTVLGRLRAAGKTTHVLLLTARDTVADRVEGLRRGADDYLVKPFALAELLARVEALCRRAYGTKAGALNIGALELDLGARRVRREGEEVELTAREWRLLESRGAARAGGAAGGNRGAHFEAAPDSTPPLKALLVVGRARGPLDGALASLRNALLLSGAATLGLFAALIGWGVGRGLAPLTRLTDRVSAVDAESLVTRLPVEPLPAELQPIAAQLNELLARLESAFARERRFTGTAAHELRTPLAELRALAEVNLTTPATDAEQTQSWQDALATTRRMESLALRLLDLARTEDTSRVFQTQTVVLAEAVAEAWEPCSARAAQRGIALESSLALDLAVRTDPALLGIVLTNLCANAAEHATPGAPLRVSGTATNGTIAVQFQNRASELTAADVPHLCERFWRKDAARTGGGHHGLGLALAAEFAGLLGGELAASLSPNGNLTFTLQLPAR